ncbi:YjeO family protein [Pectobacterium brasiliense]|uniref:YjeO family protein n=1 Tax=Pectobacterium brasiliense TaxID=180957 RepID=UPI001968B2F1|nr:YjeO family protein [Pectobacterium brasiliense]MBN3125526.1 YjeO family protein [Pectobacterium brasiliense]QSD22620.1 YjeO family protein [Pectobacterium brasiliense]
MNISKEKIVDVISMAGYVVFAYFVMGLLSINKYDWMMESGDSICSIPHQSLSNRTLQAGVAALFLLTPLFIALARNIYMKNRYKTVYYTAGILCVTLYGGWIFFGQFALC